MFSESKIELCLVLFVTVLCGQILCFYGDGGSSVSKRKQDDHGNYAFSYKIKDHKGAENYRSEKGDKDNNVEGSYGLRDIDGRMRVVDYWADKKNGFTAKIRSNEPGVGDADAADAIYNGPDSKSNGPSHADVESSYGNNYGNSYGLNDYENGY